MSFIFAVIFGGVLFASSPVPTANLEATDWQNPVASVDETEVTENTYPLNPDGRISVSNINGSLEVVGWDRAEVLLVSKKVANTKERLQDLEIRVTSNPDLLRVEVDYKRWKGKWVKGDSLYVNFKLMVPRTAKVSELESVNGGVTVSGLINETKVSAVNGAVKGTELKGNVNLATVNGSVVATFEQLDASAEVSLSTVNGSAQIILPSNVNATIKADSVNGSITNDFGLPVRKGKYVGRDLYGRIGSGTSKIRLNTVNGSIKIKRSDDGQTVNPVENLLPQKTSDDFDDTFDDSLEDGEKANRIAAEAEKIARETIEASKEFEKEALLESERIAAEAATASVEALREEIAGVTAVEIDRDRIAAEVAAVSRTLAGNKPAPYLLEDSKSITVEGVRDVSVLANGCNVTVRGWDKSEIRYSVLRLARGRTSPVRSIGFSNDGSGIVINVQVANPPADAEVLEQVQVEVYVPRKTNLKIKSDREIRLVGVTGELELSGKHGGIDVRDAGGRLELESANATVRVIGFQGELDSRIGMADMYLDGDFQKITSYSKGGLVYLTLAEGNGAMISTNALGSVDGISASEGPRSTENLRLLKKSDGMWQVGSGEAEYDFRFAAGKLVLRSRSGLSSD